VFVLEGSVSLNGTELGRRDSSGVWNVDQVELTATADATDVMIVETLMIDDEKIKMWEAEQVHH
jgi:hypothetical protein